MIPNILRSAALIGLGIALTYTTAYADTYDLTLTATNGPESGSGSFTINGPVTPTGVFSFGSNTSTYSGAHLLTALTLNFEIGGQQYAFDLANESSKPYGQFINDALTDFTYEGTIVNTGIQLDLVLQANGLTYSFSDIYNSSLDTTGNITASLDPPAGAPEPMSLALLVTVLMLVWYPLRKARSNAA